MTALLDPPDLLTIDQRKAMIAAAYQTAGAANACDRLGFSPRALMHTRRADPEFAAELEMAEEYHVERLAGALHVAALVECRSGKTATAKQLLKLRSPRRWTASPKPTKAAARTEAGATPEPKTPSPSPRTQATAPPTGEKPDRPADPNRKLSRYEKKQLRRAAG